MVDQVVKFRPEQVVSAKSRIIDYLVKRGYKRERLVDIFNCKCFTLDSKWCASCENYLINGNKQKVIRRFL